MDEETWARAKQEPHLPSQEQSWGWSPVQLSLLPQIFVSS